MTAVLNEQEVAVETPPVPLDTPEQVLDALRKVGTMEEVLANTRRCNQITSLMQTIASVKQQRSTEAQEHVAWLDRLQDYAAEQAEDDDWCGEFESRMENAGLESRRTVTVAWTATVTVRYEPSDDDIEAIFDGLAGGDAKATDFGGEDLHCTITVSGSVEGRRNECVCDDVRIDSDMLPSWVVASGCEWDEEDVRCDND